MRTAPTLFPPGLPRETSSPLSPSWDTLQELAYKIISFELSEEELLSQQQVEIFREFLTMLNFLGPEATEGTMVKTTLKMLFSKFSDPHTSLACVGVGKTTAQPCTVGATKWNGCCGHHQDQSLARVFPSKSLTRFNQCSLTGETLSSSSTVLQCISCPRQVSMVRAVAEFSFSSLEDEQDFASKLAGPLRFCVHCLGARFGWVKVFGQLTVDNFKLSDVVPLPLHEQCTSPTTMGEAFRRATRFQIRVPASLARNAPPLQATAEQLMQTIAKKRGTTNAEMRAGAQEAMDQQNQAAVSRLLSEPGGARLLSEPSGAVVAPRSHQRADPAPDPRRVLFGDAGPGAERLAAPSFAQPQEFNRFEMRLREEFQAQYQQQTARQEKMMTDMVKSLEAKIATLSSVPSSGENFASLTPPPDPESSSEEPSDMYGFKVSEPGHTYHPRFAGAEDYTGTELSAKHKALRRDAVGQDRLDKSDQLKRLPEHRDTGASKFMIGDISVEGTSTKLGVADKLLWDRYAAARITRFTNLLIAADGVYAEAHAQGWFRINARLVIGRYQFLYAVADYLTNVRFPTEQWPVVWRVMARTTVLQFDNRGFNKLLSFDRELLALVPDTGSHSLFPSDQLKLFAQEKFNPDVLVQVHSLMRGASDLDSALTSEDRSSSAGSTANNDQTKGGSPRAQCKACGGAHDITACKYPVRIACAQCGLPHISIKGSPRFVPCDTARSVMKAGDQAMRQLKNFKGGTLKWHEGSVDKSWTSK